MEKKRKTSSLHPLIHNPYARIIGQDAPAHVVLQQVKQKQAFPIEVRLAATPPAVDYTLIDPALALQPPATTASASQPLPPTGAGYAAFTPTQRYALLQWLNQPGDPAPAAFQQFYLAQLEVGLLEPPQTQAVENEVQRLLAAPAWQHHIGLARLRLLAYWLTKNGPGLADWLSNETAPGPLLGVALGQQALLGQALQPEQLPILFHHWAIDTPLIGTALHALRLSSLAATLGHEPLAHALAQLADSAQQPQPWRSQHRDLRIALPQPDLRSGLEPLLRDLASVHEAVDGDHNDDDSNDPHAVAGNGWQLVLEFGESRSDFFALALSAAQKQPGYVALMDEDRHMVHRVHFQKGEIRRFWRLWEYVQSWSSTKVYINGDEISKWELYGRLWQVR